MKEKNPDATFGEMGKILGAEWKSLTDDDKVEYQDQAVEDKQRYDREMKKWITNFHWKPRNRITKYHHK